MKQRILSMVFALLIISCFSGAACAATKASEYFGYTDVGAYAMGDEEIMITFDIDATHTMLEVGATEVYIFEEQSDGSFDNVYTFYSTDHYSDMMDTNDAFGNGEVYYYGTAGLEYYAKCALYARDSNGAETRYYNTLTVTCLP